MGLIIAIAIIVVSILGAALSQQLSDEFKAWTPWLVEHLIQCAIRLLPEEHHERLNEEWRSHVNDTPGQIGKIIVAAGFLVASRRIAPSRLPSRQLSQSKPRNAQRLVSTFHFVYRQLLIPSMFRRITDVQLRFIANAAKIINEGEDYDGAQAETLVKMVVRTLKDNQEAGDK
jgi:hypothetical protein